MLKHIYQTLINHPTIGGSSAVTSTAIGLNANSFMEATTPYLTYGSLMLGFGIALVTFCGLVYDRFIKRKKQL